MKDALHIIKLGGSAIDNTEELTDFLNSFSQISGLKILVHGGGKIATRIGARMNIQSVYSNGRRITDDESIDLVTMVFAGLLNKKIVAALQSNGCNAIGLSGADGNAIQTEKRKGSSIDYGFVGDLNTDSVNSELIIHLLQYGLTPVFNAITHNNTGQLLNTNADTIASALASALSSSFNVRLTYTFDRPGVLLDPNDPHSVIQNLNRETFQQLKNENSIHSGMLPKLESCFRTLNSGVDRIQLCHTSAINDALNLKGIFTSIYN
jgi:acetylglutamate kinase